MKNLLLLCCLCSNQTNRTACKIRREVLEDNKKVRVSKSSGVIIERPVVLERLRSKKIVDSPKDTAADLVAVKTFDLLSLLPSPNWRGFTIPHHKTASAIGAVEGDEEGATKEQ